MTGEPSRAAFITSRPVAILMIFAAMAVFGVLSLGRLPVTLMPELTYPTVTVRTEYPGAAPEEVENDVSRPVEEALGVIGGLSKISSISRAGLSDVVLEFAWDTDMSDATQSVLERLDMVFLPEEAERPLILHYDPSLDPVLELSLSGSGERFEGESGLRRLRRLAELQIKKELEPIKGVAAARVRGGLEEEIHVLLDEASLRRSNLSIQQVIDRLAQENINVAGGTLKEGRTEYLVRTLNEFENLDQISKMIVATLDGRDVRITDLGRVERSHLEREILTRTDGRDSVQIEIFKEGDANIVDLAKRVRTALGEFEPPVPGATGGDADRREGDPPRGLIAQLWNEEGARLQLVADRSLFIESSIGEVRNTAIIGGLLAILVLYLFLRNALSTAIVAVSIPISLFITFAPLNLLGVSLNIMSLGGLALGIGMLVDSSIVVLESIYRCREEGDEIESAAIRGTGEVRGAVFASTLTSIAVFFPMVFVEGLAGQAFGDLGLAVVVSLLASAGVALFFIPMLASRRGIRVDGAVPPAAGDAGPGSALPRERRWLAFHSWSATKRSFAGWRRLARPIRFKRWYGWPSVVVVWPLQFIVALVAPLYWIARLVIGLLLEIVGKLATALFAVLTVVVGAVTVGIGRLLRIVLWPAKRAADVVLGSLNSAYPSVLRGALRHPGLVVLLVGVCFWVTWQTTRSLDSELLPEVHQGEFTIETALPVGTPLEETESIVGPIESAILADNDDGAIEALLVTIGFDSANSQRSDEGEHTARFKVLLAAGHRDADAEAATIDRLRGRFAGVPDLEARVVRPVLFSSKTPIEVEIHGDRLDALRAAGERATVLLSALPELADVETSLRRGAPEVQVIYDRDLLSRYELNIQQVARLVRDKVKGYEATRFNMKDRRVPIVVRLADADRETVADVSEVIINPGSERPIRMSAVASVELGEGPSEVRRVDGRRVALITANLAAASLGSATERIEETLHAGLDLPSDMTFYISGQNEEWERSRTSLWVALALSVFLVYVIMAAQFESLLHPLVIMLTIPLAFVGTVLTLRVLGMALSIVVFLGMIMLAGIVVNNAIVLVDYINTLRRRGMERDEAIVTGGTVRLRPILMTTTTTVLGLLPMALGFGDGAEIRTPMAIAVISGLLSSTALTLIVIPSVYMLVDEMKSRLLGRHSVEGAPMAAPGAGASATPSPIRLR